MSSRKDNEVISAKKSYVVYEAIGLALLFGIWFLGSFLIQRANPQRGRIILPSPVQVINDFPGFATYSLEAKGQPSLGLAFWVLIQYSAVSLARLFSGTIIGVVSGILIGLLMGTYKYFNKLVSPSLMIIRTIPILALIPLFLVWFGGKEEGNILYISFAVFCMIVINTIEAIKNVPPIYQKFAATLGASKRQTFQTVVLPCILPELIGGIRVVIGLSWAIVLAAEYLAAESGIGYMLISSERYMSTSKMIVLIVLIMIFATILNQLFLKLGNYIIRWKPRIGEK